MKNFFAAMLAVLFVLLATACTNHTSTSQPTQKALRITYDSSLYGTSWMNTFSKAFQSAHPGILLKITADAQLTQHYTALLESKNSLPDLIFAARTDWQEDASSGKLSSLDTFYQTEVGGIRIAAKLRADTPAYEWNGHAYVYPWGARTGGFLYNAGLFTQYGWQVPQTVSQLLELCTAMQAVGIAPFAWSADHAYDWTENVTEWWAQFEGQAAMQTYLSMQNSDVYGQQGRLVALQTFARLIPSNSYKTPLTMNESAAVKTFTSGQSAMIPAGYLPDLVANPPSTNLDIREMALPSPDGAKEPLLLAATIPGMAVIPAKASEPKLAELFLTDMSTDQSINAFIQTTGCFTPFRMDNAQTESLSLLLKSAAALWQNETVYMVSLQPAYYRRLFDWPAEGSPVLQIFSGSRTAQEAFDQNLQAARSEWASSGS